MKAIGLCTIMIGFTGMTEGHNALITIVSMILGTGIGTLIDLDGCFGNLGKLAEKILPGKKGRFGNLCEGFITACLLFCVGAMTILGCFQAGLKGEYTTLYTKSLLDFISAIMLSVSIGAGVLFSSAFVFFFQGSLVLLADILQPLLNEMAIEELTCTGSILIFSIGINLLGITKLKTTDMLPAILISLILSVIIYR